ncbi:Golgi to ER retrograde transport protein [Schizosaccharomyces pombe]|uniref:Protein pdh1 n=1 Tax=Schizosaccharomyces pombe (strain 972 / ATCC 24843) TaxID=284812 RepID=PDH1_SCHPO|nr:protein pdh1 [Schizosaccharomyces pombe]O42826.1 RecName: Full=Protein pdh1; Flags: Precursor [Schizosaccharomyces pombe 972h-]BAA24946.1 PDH1P [Schizosaccharomyces pombe]CAA21112.1 DUF1751 family protein [Schizosaccharomyces pombe]|eukprot:NP_587734.1 protein pdh1 [Schizosaccharomyces pombe]
MNHFSKFSVTKRLLILEVLFSAISFGISIYIKVFGRSSIVTFFLLCFHLVPNALFLFPWTIITTSFVDANVFTLLSSILILSVYGVEIERSWGHKEYLLFCQFLTVIPNIAVLIPCFIAYKITDSHYLLVAIIQSTTAIQAGILTAWYQLYSCKKEESSNKFLCPLSKYLIYLFLSIHLFYVFQSFPWTYFCLAVSGTCISELYVLFVHPVVQELFHLESHTQLPI